MDNFIASFVPILGILSGLALPIFASAYIINTSVRARAKERMELIKQGIIPQQPARYKPRKYTMLRNGFLCIGISLGLIIGIIAHEVLELVSPLNILVIVSSVLLFLGAAYVIFYLLTINKSLEDQSDDR